MNSTCAILASDFSSRTTDTFRHVWTETKISFLLAAVGDTPVVLTTNRSTGHTLVGVRLTGQSRLPNGYNTAVVHTEWTAEDGTVVRAGHKIRDLGEAIIPLTRGHGRGVKWEALEIQREHNRAAVEAVYAWQQDNGGRDRDDASGWYGGVVVSAETGSYGRSAYVTWTGARDCDRDESGALGSRAGWQTFTVDTRSGGVSLGAGYGSPVSPSGRGRYGAGARR